MISSSSERPVLLIVDDEPVNIELLASLLSLDYEIKVATDGHKALEIANREPSPDLILMDVMMPKLDGFEVCRQLKTHPRTRDIPVIFITAIGGEAEYQGLEVGAVDYISKPINTAVTQLRVKAHVDMAMYRRGLRQNLGFMSTMIESAPLAIAVVNRDYQCVLLNRSGLDAVGCQTLEYARVTSKLERLDFLGGRDAVRCRRALRKALRGKNQSVQTSVIRKGERKRWFDIRLSALRDAEGRVMGALVLALDLTETKQNQDRLHLLAKVFENILEGIVITDLQGQVVDFNPAYSKITGYSVQEILTTPFGLSQIDHHGETFQNAMRQVLKQGEPWQGEIFSRRKNGELITEWLSLNPIKDDNNNAQYYLGIFNDITKLKKREAQLEKVSHYDLLTGLPNRILLVERIKQSLADLKQKRNLMAICYLDLDEFKLINDHQGLQVGNAVLVECAKRLLHAVSEIHTVARVGGDEFVIILQGLHNIDQCQAKLDEVLAELNRDMLIGDQIYKLSASIGVALAHGGGDPDTLLRYADHAMYAAKSTGKNCYQFFDTNEDERIRELNGKLQRIRQALENQEFELYFQPKVHMLDHRVIGAEALIRWRHPELGLLSPVEFLPVIAGTDLECSLGEWVLENALAQQSAWRSSGLNLELSINISPNHLQSPNFLAHFRETLRAYPNLPPRAIQIEVLETAALEDVDAAMATMQACHDLGVVFALDDFGTGYSSLTYLCKLPVNTIKIDQTFVRDMLCDESSLAVVIGVIALSKSFSREIVAEGVETDKHYSKLAEMGCVIGQGYAIAKPMRAADFEVWCYSDERFSLSVSDLLQRELV